MGGPLEDVVGRWTAKRNSALNIDCHRRELLGGHLSRTGKATTAVARLGRLPCGHQPRHSDWRLDLGRVGQVNTEQ